MAWTQGHLDALDNAIAKGARRVKYKDYEAEFHSLKDMLSLRSLMQDELGLSATPNQRHTQYITSKGL